uniref:Auxin efflux carrier n=1 Tax=Tetradesmus obliquus TaxID=3088 RepID=A0A383V5U6_TETOB|eukprot:jgi/Sobl393_1/3498/SZX60987.1
MEHVNVHRPFNISRPRHSSATHPRGSNSTCSAAAVVSSSTSSPRARQLACRTAAVLQPYQLAAIAAEPVVKVALLSGGGALCAKQGILTLEGRRMLSGLIMNVFTPALLLSKLVSSVDVSLALSLWPLAANMLLCHAAGLGIGWLQVQLTGIPPELRAQTLVMNTAGNIGNLPLVMVPSLIASPDVLISAEGKEMAITYVMLGFFVASFIQFPCGYLLLQRPAATQGTDKQQQQPKLAAAAAAALVSTTAVPIGAPVSAAAAAGPEAAAAASAGILQQPSPQQQQQQPSQLSTLAKGVFTPPLIACLLAIPVAAVPELKEHLFTPTGGLHVLGEALAMLGAPLIPCLFLVLGANLAEGPGAAQVPPKFLLSMIAGKLLLHPLAGMALVLGALKLQLLPQGLDPLVPLVMMMVWATPTAVLVHSLATMLRNGEDQVSCFLFWQYLASLATLPAFMALYLQLLQSGQLAS